MSSTPGGAQARNCVSCGRSIQWDANVCPYCGHDYRVAMAGPAAQKKETAMPMIAGILLIICSLVYFGGGAVMAAGGSFLWGWEDSVGDTDASGVLVVCGAIMIVLGIIVLLGGVFSIQRRHFALSLIGSILALGSILGIIALILIIVARDEYH